MELADRSRKRRRIHEERKYSSIVPQNTALAATTIYQDSLSDSQLCKSCSKINFRRFFTNEIAEHSLGYLESYSDPQCAFCALIEEALNLAWGDAMSVSFKPNSTLPELYMKSKSPWTFTHEGSRMRPQPRLLLAIDEKPPNYSLGRPRISLVDSKDRYIFAEVELISSIPNLPIASKEGHNMPTLLRQTIDPHFDLSLAATWLKLCQRHQHSKDYQCEDRIKRYPGTGFRLIDVVNGCLVQDKKVHPYVALSYVWGNVPGWLKCTTGSVHYLSIPGIVTSPTLFATTAERVPQTILDAITVTKKLGYRRLWVDALCILQDDPDEKRRLIHGMDDVFANAAVTIVAAAGKDADAGLPGISPRENRPHEKHFILKRTTGPRLTVALSRPSLVSLVRKSHWNSRAWTYQEQCMSRRCLYFTPTEVFLSCTQNQWREGYTVDGFTPGCADLSVRFGSPWWNSVLRADRDACPSYFLTDLSHGVGFEDYWRIVHEYTRKNLSFPDDILNAFEGIFKRFISSDPGQGSKAAASVNGTNGIPPSLFPFALLWLPGKGASRRDASESPPSSVGSPSPSVRTRRLPTWSWAAWSGPINFIDEESGGFPKRAGEADMFQPPASRSETCSIVDHWYCIDSISEFRLVHRGPDTSFELDKMIDYRWWYAQQDTNNVKWFIEDQYQLQTPGELVFYAPVHSAQFRYDSIIDCHSEWPKFWGFRADPAPWKGIDKMVIVCASGWSLADRVFVIGVRTENGISRRVGIGQVFWWHLRKYKDWMEWHKETIRLL